MSVKYESSKRNLVKELILDILKKENLIISHIASRLNMEINMITVERRLTELRNDDKVEFDYINASRSQMPIKLWKLKS